MKNKIFLTSIFAIAFACPAFAIDGNATIENGDTCNVDNLGTSTNNDTANLEAIWTLDPRTCTAGQYYDATTNTCLTCEAGSFCGGGTFNVESNPNGGGTTLCSTLTGGYNSSDSGAGANTDCYKGCVASDVAHAETVSGNVYYDPNDANGNKQCSATACAAGWHVKEGLDLTQYVSTQSTSSSLPGKCIVGQKVSPNISFDDYEENGHNASYYGFNEQDFNDAHNTKWGSDLGFAVIYGDSICSNVEGDNSNNYSNAMATTELTYGYNSDYKYCWCKLIKFRLNNDSYWTETPTEWFFLQTFSASYNCYGNGGGTCKEKCAEAVGENYAFRSVLFNDVQPSLATCEANNIGLAWYNDTVANNGTTITPNNSAANQCTYSGTITVPTNEMQKPGYTFGGWKLRTNN